MNSLQDPSLVLEEDKAVLQGYIYRQFVEKAIERGILEVLTTLLEYHDF